MIYNIVDQNSSYHKNLEKFINKNITYQFWIMNSEDMNFLLCIFCWIILCKVRVTFVTLQKVQLIRINYVHYYLFLWWKSALKVVEYTCNEPAMQKRSHISSLREQDRICTFMYDVLKHTNVDSLLLLFYMGNASKDSK